MLVLRTSNFQGWGEERASVQKHSICKGWSNLYTVQLQSPVKRYNQTTDNLLVINQSLIEQMLNVALNNNLKVILFVREESHAMCS